MSEDIDLDREIREILDRAQAKGAGATINFIIGNRGVVIIGDSSTVTERDAPTQDCDQSHHASGSGT